jgi:hypothetical protein
MLPAPISPPRIVVVGPCASGKSTLVSGLRANGYDARAAGQEHSEIPTLWRHLGEPDYVIALAVDLPTIRRRRGDRQWPAWLYALQQRRLRQAVAAASLVIDTTEHDAGGVLDEALAGLATKHD